MAAKADMNRRQPAVIRLPSRKGLTLLIMVASRSEARMMAMCGARVVDECFGLGRSVST